jgi:hypothetical protein
MLKKRKHKIKRRNTEPSVNHPLVLATPSANPGTGGEKQKHKHDQQVGGPSSAGAAEGQQSPPFNLADICDSPTHATAV